MHLDASKATQIKAKTTTAASTWVPASCRSLLTRAYTTVSIQWNVDAQSKLY